MGSGSKKRTKFWTDQSVFIFLTSLLSVFLIFSCSRSKDPTNLTYNPPYQGHFVRPVLHPNWPSYGSKANILVGDGLANPDSVVYWFWIGINDSNTVKKLDSLYAAIDFQWIGGEIIYNDTLANGFYFNPDSMNVSGGGLPGNFVSSIKMIRDNHLLAHQIKLVPAYFDTIIYTP
jgi:hypothetical protein